MPELTVEKMDGITLIINDHRIVDQLFTQYEQAGDPNMKLGLVAKMIEELSVHADVEEREMYPLIREKLEDGQELFEHALEEHRVAKEVLAELEILPVTNPQFDEKVRELISEVRHHVEEEESELLPKLRESLSESELLDLGTKLREAKGSAPVRPKAGEGNGSTPEGATKEELYERAKELDIEGRSDMTKDELDEAISTQD